MQARPLTWAAAALLALGASRGEAAISFDDVEVELWTGAGERSALMIVDWQEGRTLAFGHRWSALDAPTDFDMLEAVADATERFFRTWVDGMEEEAIFGLGWDADGDGFAPRDPDDWYEEGWFTDGFWSQWVSADGEAWEFGPGLGLHALEDGAFVGWSWAPDFIADPPDVPLVPAPSGALALLGAILPRRGRRRAGGARAVAGALALAPAALGGAEPFAIEVVSYDAGANPVPGYTNPAAALGAPARFTGGAFEPMVVSALNGAWRPDEVVSIGAGGRIVLRFAAPVTDDPDNPYGIDLLVFGNAFFADGAPPDGIVSDPATIFIECGSVEVSHGGESWTPVTGLCADALFPTEGWLDLDWPYEVEPGGVPSSFTKPVDPSLALADFDGLAYAEALELYRGSGGGLGIDLGALGLAAVTHVAISAPPDATDTPEIDAVADVAPRRPGDATLDGTVGFADLLFVLSHWGPARPDGWDGDFDGDGAVSFPDLLAVLAHWS
jgi:hypothetical protein